MYRRFEVKYRIFLTACLLLWSLCSLAQLRIRDEDSHKNFELLVAELQNFRTSGQTKDKSSYPPLINKFQQFSRSFSRSVDASTASFYAIRLYDEYAHLTQEERDYKATVRGYLKHAEAFAEHESADEALYRAARISATQLKDKARAIELLRQIIKHGRFASEHYAKARHQLTVITHNQKRILAIDKRVVGSEHTIEIKTDGKVQFSAGELAAFGKYPRRLYIDLKPVRLERNYQETLTGAGLKKIRYGQFGSDVARVVFEIEDNVAYRINDKAINGIVGVSFSKKAAKAEQGISATLATLPEKPAPSIPVKNDPLHAGPQRDLRFKVVIDPGHGGNDPGAIGPNNTQEKHITLQIAQRISAHLRKQMPEVMVHLTRENDKTMSLSERTAFANKVGADLFISVHANASPSHTAEGIETYYLDITSDSYSIRLAARENEVSVSQVTDLEYILADLTMKSNTQQSISLGEKVHKGIFSKVKDSWNDVKDLGLKHALFYVLIGARMPAILIESSFISNHKEEKRLSENDYQDAIAQGVVLGIKRYTSTLSLLRRS